MKKIKFIGLNYYCHKEFSNAEEVISKHRPTDLYLRELANKAETVLVKHMAVETACIANEIRFHFFRRKNSFWQIPRETHRFIAAQNPDVVLVQGLIFPLQVKALRRKLDSRCKIILQHQGEVPFKRKKIFQRMADKVVDGYLFSSMGIAEEWQRAGIIKSISKCFEMPPASFLFKKKGKEECKSKTGMNAPVNFLWAGRLNANKDPLTVLEGFEKYFAANTGARLYMIYQENDLLEAVIEKINTSPLLKERVIVVGKIENAEMETWYNAADYIVSGSHYEGGSYALMEALACGCVPIVTDIPASVKTIDGGRLGYIYEKGNPEALFKILFSLKKDALLSRSKACAEYYVKEMSPGAVASKMLAVFETLQSK
ncbi:MAG: glycosyltransferase family 4 protein [Sphingobacteriales bacterium]|nr:glycosyltransferase family 4 protein [Sphingobacteriales bacterium]